jgi:hypothetical protein
VNVDPTPGLLSTVTSPPIIRQNRRVSARPKPVPPNFRLVLRTQSYDVYKRVGATPTRFPYEAPGQPGAVFDCDSDRGRQYSKLYKWAGVLPSPIVKTDWQGSIGRPGETARIRVKLPRGRWDVSLQYVSTTGLTVKAPGLTKQMAANFGLITAFWPAGTVTSDGRTLTLSVSAHDRTWFAGLLGKPRGLRAPLSPGLRPLNQIAFTRHGETPRRVPARGGPGRVATFERVSRLGGPGFAAGVAAYLLWGIFPLYWPLLEPAGSVEILAHRIVWALVFVAGLLALTGGFGWVRTLGAVSLGALMLGLFALIPIVL